MIRKPYVAGRFYDGQRETLIKEIESCFLSKVGPGKIPQDMQSEGIVKIRGGVCPHAGYIYSGHEAAHFYLELFKSELPDTIIILGPSHRSYSNFKIAVFTGGGFETPLGICPADKELACKIASEAPFGIDNNAHIPEHSLEVQVPFIQYIYEKAGALDKLKIVPLCVIDQDYETALKASDGLFNILKNETKKIAFVASSDFSHYISADDAKRRDSYAINEILKLDCENMYRQIVKHDISMCGYGPISIMVETLKKLYGAENISCKLLKYGTSGDITPMSEVVGYAAIEFILN